MFFSFWQQLAENITTDLRIRYLARLMEQEIAFFDKNNVEQLPSQMAEIFETVQGAIGEKFSNMIFAVSTCLSGIGYALYFAPVYAAICILYLPFLLSILGIFGRMVQKTALQKVTVVKNLGGIAEETLTAIKVVASFGREERELDKFVKWSLRTLKVAKRSSSTFSFMVGLMKFCIFFFYTYALVIGTVFIQTQRINTKTGKPYDQKDVLEVVIALITGFIGLIAALPNIQVISASRVQGKLIFDVIDRVPEIKSAPTSSETQRLVLNNFIHFDNVTFKYPTALVEHKPILQNANFKIKAGDSTAIVGPSGSGKSTIIQLIERFYDPSDGAILFDTENIKDIHLGVLRDHIGLVSQEPVMILGTIRDNLLYGNADATEGECEEALKRANAQFVFDLENGMDTFVGTAGVMNMSGGQKQRIAIARALIKKPKILILDEATSALDPKSELEVQEAIEKIGKEVNGLTILIIAHRLTTISSANNLLFFRSRS